MKKISYKYNRKYTGTDELEIYHRNSLGLGFWLEHNCLDLSIKSKEPGHRKYFLPPSTLIDFESGSRDGRNKGLFSLIIEKEPKPVSAEIDLMIQRYENLPEELIDMLKGFMIQILTLE